MFSIISGIAVPIIYHAVFRMICSKKYMTSGVNKKKRKTVYDGFIFIMILETVLFTVLNLISIYAMNNSGSYINPVIFIIAGVLPFLYIIVRNFTENDSLRNFLKKSSILMLTLIAAEVFIFNGKSFDSSKITSPISAESISLTDGAVLGNGQITINSPASLTINNVPDGTTALMIGFDKTIDRDSHLTGVSLFMKDDNLGRSYEFIQSKLTMAGKHETSLSFQPYGKVRSLRVDISDVNQPVLIDHITAVSRIPFAFSLIRYFVLSGIGCLIFAVLSFKWWKITYQSGNRLHIILTEAMTVLCTLSVFIMTSPFEKPAKYDSKSPNIADPWSMTFDAFKKKQTNLDIETDPGLETLENVYDTSERNETGIGGWWDLAYYKGKYYCYFGCAPLLTFYYPYYMITEKLPTVGMALGFFGILAVWFMCRTILATVKLLLPRANLLLLLGFMAAAPGITGIYYCVNAINNYTLPTICGLCWIFLCLWTGLEACLSKKKIFRFVLLFISGTSLALCAASRPGIILCSVVLVPLFIGILRNKEFTSVYRGAQTACFAVPLLIGGFLLMVYNSARFGSPFDFGYKYQLTVSNISANTMSTAGLPPMLYHYFFQLPRASATFPFFEPTFCMLYNYKKYTYLADCVGVFTYPVIAAGSILMPAVAGRRRGSIRSGVKRSQRSIIIILCFAAAVLIGWSNFCLGGAVTRYVVDLMPILMLGTLICVLRGAGDPKKHPMRYILLCISIAASFVISWLLMIQVRDGSLLRRFPEIYDTVEDLVIFWQ